MRVVWAASARRNNDSTLSKKTVKGTGTLKLLPISLKIASSFCGMAVSKSYAEGRRMPDRLIHSSQ